MILKVDNKYISHIYIYIYFPAIVKRIIILKPKYLYLNLPLHHLPSSLKWYFLIWKVRINSGLIHLSHKFVRMSDNSHQLRTLFVFLGPYLINQSQRNEVSASLLHFSIFWQASWENITFIYSYVYPWIFIGRHMNVYPFGRMEDPYVQWLCLFSLLYPQCLKQYLVHQKCSNICCWSNYGKAMCSNKHIRI